MRIQWHENKQRRVLQKRQIDFTRLPELLSLPYIEDQRTDDPEQYRIVGFIAGRLVPLVVEYRQDELGEYIWVVTAWKATKQEEEAYEREIAGY